MRYSTSFHSLTLPLYHSFVHYMKGILWISCFGLEMCTFTFCRVLILHTSSKLWVEFALFCLGGCYWAFAITVVYCAERFPNVFFCLSHFEDSYKFSLNFRSGFCMLHFILFWYYQLIWAHVFATCKMEWIHAEIDCVAVWGRLCTLQCNWAKTSDPIIHSLNLAIGLNPVRSINWGLWSRKSYILINMKHSFVCILVATKEMFFLIF